MNFGLPASLFLYMHYLKIKIHQTNKFYQFRKKYAYEYFRGKETEIVLY